MRAPKTAYVLLWFPKPSETFVFWEVVNLRKMGLPLSVFALYGELTSGLSAEMQAASKDVERLGMPFLKRAPASFLYWLRRDRDRTVRLTKEVLFRRWKGLEKSGESLWAFLCGFHMARRAEAEKIEHIHASWASGPATAAWVASRLTGIPFSFTARAWDIYPPDSVLKEKLRDAAFVRSDNFTNISYLGQFCNGDTSKIYLTYNGIPLQAKREAPVTMQPPYRLLALGRFVGKKGYDFLLEACKLLKDSGTDFRLTLAGDGPRATRLKRQALRLGIAENVSFPGFVSYDRVSNLFDSSDLLVMPSVIHSSGDRDGIPTVIMEALMHRVPVVATDVTGIAEVVEDEATGLLIPEKNPQAIADAIRRMTADRDFAIRTAEQGRARVLDQFDPARNHKRVLQLYQDLVPAGNR